jgi:tetratricopeptide (TPR) repeat protein
MVTLVKAFILLIMLLPNFAAVGQDVRTPAIKEDIAENDKPNERITGRIEQFDDRVIVYKRRGRGEALRVPNRGYRLVHRDGHTNGEELLQVAGRILVQVENALILAEVDGSTVERQRELLGQVPRILQRFPADSPFAVDPRLRDFANRADELQIRLDRVIHRDRILVWLTLVVEPLDQLWLREDLTHPDRFERIENAVSEVRESLATKTPSGIPSDIVIPISREVEGELSAIASLVRQLPPLRDPAEDEAIDSLQRLLLEGHRHAEILMNVPAMKYLPGFEEWRKQSQVRVTNLKRLVNETLSWNSKVNELKESWETLERDVAGENAPLPQTFENHVKDLESECQRLFAELRRAASESPHRVYAARHAAGHLRQLVESIVGARLSLLLRLHQDHARQKLAMADGMTALLLLQRHRQKLREHEGHLEQLLSHPDTISAGDLHIGHEAERLWRAGIVRTELRHALLELSQLEERLTTWFPTSSAEQLAAGEENAANMAEQFEGLRRRVVGLRGRPGLEESTDLARGVVERMDLVENVFRCCWALASVQRQLLDIPPSSQLARVEDVETSKLQFQAAEDSWIAVKAVDHPSVHRVREYVRLSLDRTKERLDLATGRVEIASALSRVGTLLSSADTHIGNQDRRSAFVALRHAERQLESLPVEPDDSSEMVDPLGTPTIELGYAPRLARLRNELDQLVHGERERRGWLRLGDSKVALLPPTPENLLLSGQSLISCGDREAARELLQQVRTIAPESVSIAQLEGRLLFADAVAREEAGLLSEAGVAYREILNRFPESLLADAAQSAANRVDYQLQAGKYRQQSLGRIVSMAGMLLLGCVALGVVCKRESRASRIHRAAYWLNLASKARDAQRRELYLNRAAMLLSRFSDDDVEAKHLRERLHAPADALDQSARSGSETMVKAFQSTPDELLGLALSDSDVSAFAFVLDWWSRANADCRSSERGTEVLEWFERVLRPTPSHALRELEAIRRQALELAQVDDSLDWPRLHAMAASHFSGDHAAVVNMAREIRWPALFDSHGDLILLTAQSLLAAGHSKDAAQLLKRLLGNRTLGSQARRWYEIALGQAVASQEIPPKEPICTLAGRLLQTDGHVPLATEG